MLEELRLERFVVSRREMVLCAICDQDFTPQQNAELLYAGPFPVSFLSPACPRSCAARTGINPAKLGGIISWPC